jgi:ribonucleoside-triphosphate reductase
MKYVRKRDRKLEDFDDQRIANAIWKAARAVGGQDRDRAEHLSAQVVEELTTRFGEDGVATVEEIQDIVEKTLIENGHAKTAKAYILYRKQHQDLRELAALLTSDDLVEQYLHLEDWRIKENSNMSFSLQGLNNYLSSTVIARYWLTRINPPHIERAHTSGDLHIHDLGVLGPYCVGWDLSDLLMSGFTGARGKIETPFRERPQAPRPLATSTPISPPSSATTGWTQRESSRPSKNSSSTSTSLPGWASRPPSPT